MRTPEYILDAINAFKTKGIDCFFVGGCVRDFLMGQPSDDIDICLVGVECLTDVQQILEFFADSVTPEPKGKAFPVWIADWGGQKIDFALARKESKAGDGRKDFALVTRGVTIDQDLQRRDLTINAIAINCFSGQMIDPFNGVKDIEEGIAREVSPAFAEDTLRVIRTARFISRFNLTPTDSLIELCEGLIPNDISPERVGMELKKMFAQAQQKPSSFFRFLKRVGWLRFHFPQVEALIGLEQDHHWHPEGDVFEHTMHCMDQTQDPFLRAVMLCHDLGKVTTTIWEDGRVKAPGHAKAGVEPTLKMLRNIKFCSNETLDKITTLVEYHMFHSQVEFSRRSVARMVRRLDSVGLTFDHLIEVCRCDVSGRPPLNGFTPNIGQDLAAELIKANVGVDIVQGRDLIKAGLKPGPHFTPILSEFRELQDKGVLTIENKNKIIGQVLAQIK